MSAPTPAQRCAGLSVILPALDEEENIENAVRAAVGAVAPLATEYEVIVVDDGSTDDTGAIADRLAAADPGHVRVIHHGANRGYGAALRSGFQAARLPYLFYTDADLQFDIREVRYFVPHLRDHDVVIGFRIYRYDSVLRCILSWIYNKLIFVLFWLPVRDIDCAFKLFRREVFDRIDIVCDDFFVDAEIVSRAAKARLRIQQVGVRHYPRQAGRTTVRPGNIPRTLWTIARMWWRIQFPKAAARWKPTSTPSTQE